MGKLEDFHKVIHFRMATHGDTNGDNLHPFRLVDGGYLMHNGIINIDCEDPRKSDTWHFVKKVVDPLIAANVLDWMQIEKKIGMSNRLATMNKAGDITLVNEGMGLWFEDAWYSNTYAWDAPGSNNKYWDDDYEPVGKPSASDDALFYSLVDGIHEAIMDRAYFHQDFDPEFMTSNEIYCELEKLTPYQLSDLADDYFRYQKNYIWGPMQ